MLRYDVIVVTAPEISILDRKDVVIENEEVRIIIPINNPTRSSRIVMPLFLFTIKAFLDLFCTEVPDERKIAQVEIAGRDRSARRNTIYPDLS